MGATPVPSLSMYFPPSSTGFNLSTAQTCAALVRIAYQQFTVWLDLGYPAQNAFSSNTSWQTGGPSGLQYGTPIWSTFEILGFRFSEPFGFVAWDGSGNVYVALRGTMTHADGIIDTEIDQRAFAHGAGNVHVGFSDVYEGLRVMLLSEINSFRSVSACFFTGHSMGSGLTSLAAADMPSNSNLSSMSAALWHYNYASPRAGDRTFAAAMNGSPVVTFRIVNTEDIVPAVPPAVSGTISYEHFGYPIAFCAQYGSIDGNHSMADCYSYAVSNPQNPLNPTPAPLLNAVVPRGIGTGRLPASAVMPAQPAAVATRPAPR